jgi:serine/threonine protein kinase
MNDQLISHYRLLQGLARPGALCPAEDLQTGGSVNLQLLPGPVPRDAAHFDRLERDLKILTVIHPNISTVLDFGEQEEGLFVITEREEGQTLEKWHARSSSVEADLARVAEFGMQIADGLTAAHAKGLVHGAIRPSNLWVTPDHGVKILHFATAEWIRADQLEQTRYLSPEQVRNERADARSDIFSFGALLFRLLTNQHAFRGDGPDTVRASILRRSPDLRLLPVPELSAVLERALEKERGIRCQNLADLRSALWNLRATLARQEAILAQQPQGKTISNYRVLAPTRTLERFTCYEAEDVFSGERVIFVGLPEYYARDARKFESFKKDLTEKAAKNPSVFPLREIGVEGTIAFVVLERAQLQLPILSPFTTPPLLKPDDYAFYINSAINPAIPRVEIRYPHDDFVPYVPPKTELAPITIIGLIFVLLAMSSVIAFVIWYIFSK